MEALRSLRPPAGQVEPHVPSLRLADGQRLAWSEYGDPRGYPLVYLHGASGCRLEFPVLTGAAALCEGVRVVAPDRPGHGRSDHRADRTLLDGPYDLAALADELGLGEFAVLGYGAGAAHAVAAAYALPERVSACGLVAPTAPRADLEDGLDPAVLRVGALARSEPGRARLVLNTTVAWPARVEPQRLLAELTVSACARDRAVASRPAVRAGYPLVVREAYRQGPHGPQHDLALTWSDWPVPLAEVEGAVEIWQGRQDRRLGRPAMATALHEQLGGRLHLSDDGHLSVLADRAGEILRTLT